MTITRAEKTAAPVPVATRHGAVTRGGKPDAAFGVNLPGKPYLAARVRPASKWRPYGPSHISVDGSS